MVKARSKNRKLVVQFVEYLVSGGAYFWVGYLLLLYLYSVLHWNLWWSTIVSNLVGWTANFLLQRFWVFNNKSLVQHRAEVTSRYIFITAVDFILNYFILLWLNNLGIPPKFGQFISSGFFTIWNYFWYRFWVFPEHMVRHRTRITAARVIAHRAEGHMGYHKAKA